MKTLLPNYRMFKATFVSPTNFRGSRVKIYETTRSNDQKSEAKIFSYDYQFNGVYDQALNILERNGLKVICTGSELKNYVFMVDSWGSEFKKVTELK